MKYLVMESSKSYAVLLDEEGRFVKSANLGYEVGDTVKNPILMQDEPLEHVKDKKGFSNKVVAAIVAIAAVVGLFIGTTYYQENGVPYTSIFMAINPEVEMVLNRKGDVLEVNGTNPDGVQLVEGYKLSSQNRNEVANELVDRAIEMGFLADGGQISIAIDTPDQELFEQYGIELRRELDGRISITIEITDMEHRNREPEEPPVTDDSMYDESFYEAPVQEPTPAPQPPATDDSDYDDTNYDDSEYNSSEPVTPPQASDSDYDDTDYDD